MNSAASQSLALDAKTIEEVNVILENPNGVVMFTSRLGMTMDADDGVECFTASVSGHVDLVKDYPGSEWDMAIAGLGSRAVRHLALIESSDVCGVHVELARMVRDGMTVPEAIRALLA